MLIKETVQLIGSVGRLSRATGIFELNNFTKEKLLAVVTKQQISKDLQELTQYYESVFLFLFFLFAHTYDFINSQPQTDNRRVRRGQEPIRLIKCTHPYRKKEQSVSFSSVCVLNAV